MIWKVNSWWKVVTRNDRVRTCSRKYKNLLTNFTVSCSSGKTKRYKKILNLYAPFVKQERSFPIQLKRTIFRATNAILPGTFNRTQNHHQPITLSDQKINSNCLLVLSLSIYFNTSSNTLAHPRKTTDFSCTSIRTSQIRHFSFSI